jgi:hypothetical protein
VELFLLKQFKMTSDNLLLMDCFSVVGPTTCKGCSMVVDKHIQHRYVLLTSLLYLFEGDDVIVTSHTKNEL